MRDLAMVTLIAVHIFTIDRTVGEICLTFIHSEHPTEFSSYWWRHSVRNLVKLIIPAALLSLAGLSGTGTALAAEHPDTPALKVCTSGTLKVGDNEMSFSASKHVMFVATNHAADVARVAVFTPQSPNEGGSAWIAKAATHDWHFHVTAEGPVKWKFSVTELATNHNPTNVTYQILSDTCN